MNRRELHKLVEQHFQSPTEKIEEKVVSKTVVPPTKQASLFELVRGEFLPILEQISARSENISYLLEDEVPTSPSKKKLLKEGEVFEDVDEKEVLKVLGFEELRMPIKSSKEPGDVYSKRSFSDWKRIAKNVKGFGLAEKLFSISILPDRSQNVSEREESSLENVVNDLMVYDGLMSLQNDYDDTTRGKLWETFLAYLGDGVVTKDAGGSEEASGFDIKLGLKKYEVKTSLTSPTQLVKLQKLASMKKNNSGLIFITIEKDKILWRKIEIDWNSEKEKAKQFYGFIDSNSKNSSRPQLQNTAEDLKTFLGQVNPAFIGWIEEQGKSSLTENKQSKVFGDEELKKALGTFKDLEKNNLLTATSLKHIKEWVEEGNAHGDALVFVGGNKLGKETRFEWLNRNWPDAKLGEKRDDPGEIFVWDVLGRNERQTLRNWSSEVFNWATEAVEDLATGLDQAIDDFQSTKNGKTEKKLERLKRLKEKLEDPGGDLFYKVKDFILEEKLFPFFYTTSVTHKKRKSEFKAHLDFRIDRKQEIHYIIFNSIKEVVDSIKSNKKSQNDFYKSLNFRYSNFDPKYDSFMKMEAKDLPLNIENAHKVKTNMLTSIKERFGSLIISEVNFLNSLKAYLYKEGGEGTSARLGNSLGELQGEVTSHTWQTFTDSLGDK